ncbi:DUF2997 domain-containing protein [Nocardioides caldifontis]|uniref:DUF2997 domain-containing protein n=1 Tax=Nocardioides caldifontis TaxID=2588938 RepID=UPI0011DF2D92|nr:DUF2997 domain-containing protein [Nocardioides caldifontis]
MTGPAQRIVVRVGADGAVTAETHGLTGPACLDQIAVLEELLGARTEQSAFTADYDRTTTTTAQGVGDELRQQ